MRFCDSRESQNRTDLRFCDSRESQNRTNLRICDSHESQNRTYLRFCDSHESQNRDSKNRSNSQESQHLQTCCDSRAILVNRRTLIFRHLAIVINADKILVGFIFSTSWGLARHFSKSQQLDDFFKLILNLVIIIRQSEKKKMRFDFFVAINF